MAKTKNKPDWQETAIYKQLAKKAAKADQKAAHVVHVLNHYMPHIHTILAKAGTPPPDFTLHDEGHALRVVVRMEEIIPKQTTTKLSAFELALLLFSAYLHDIGMTPERGKVTRHYMHLLTGQGLDNEEVPEFQRWIDDHSYDAALPMVEGRPASEDDLMLANEIITYYCRHKHNDWSADWIRENLKDSIENAKGGNVDEQESLYPGWVDDLVTLCRSHHEGYNELRSNRFDPKKAAPHDDVVHLRYLAAVLRVADILEFDPERAPDVILRHRGVAPKSLVYWYQNQTVTRSLDKDRYSISAQPLNARYHRAIEIMADDIEGELALCQRLADECPFDRYPGQKKALPHKWSLQPYIFRDIRPKPGAYEYINGAFRPDTERLLQLLGGLELYGNELVTVRELLQNAFDAVREEIAYKRLNVDSPADLAWDKKLGDLHRVTLSLEQQDGDWWLICHDDGIGMTKTIIQDHFLVSGNVRRHDILDLEWRCDQAGFILGRTGQFGVGALTYFMIADRIIIQTRRSQAANDAEPQGWEFETEGIDCFGELRARPHLPSGTTLKLHLNSEINRDPKPWYNELRTYVAETAIHIPCQLQLTTHIPDSEPLSLRQGWTRTDDDIACEVIAALRPRDYSRKDDLPYELLPKDKRGEAERDYDAWQHIRDEADKAINWIKTEGWLPDGLGYYRSHVCQFAIHGGNSLAFLRTRKAAAGTKVLSLGDSGNAYLPRIEIQTAWKGMRIEIASPDKEIPPTLWFSYGKIECNLPVYLEVSWTNRAAGQPLVSRTTLRLSRAAVEGLADVCECIRKHAVKRLNAGPPSDYDTLNAQLLDSRNVARRTCCWLYEIGSLGNKTTGWWKSIVFPSLAFGMLPGMRVKWRGALVSTPSQLRETGRRFSVVSWVPPGMSPAWIAQSILPGGEPLLLAVFDQPDVWHPSSLRAASLPPQWSHVAAVKVPFSNMSREDYVWNANHPLVTAVTEQGLLWAAARFRQMPDPLQYRKALLSDLHRAAGWLIECINRNQKSLWRGVAERDPEFVHGLWHNLFASGPAQALCDSAICIRDEYASMSVVSPSGWNVVDVGRGKEEDRLKWLPDPGPDWTIEVDWGNKSQADT